MHTNQKFIFLFLLFIFFQKNFSNANNFENENENKLSTFNFQLSTTKIDTFDPAQRFPEGVTRPVPKRILPIATTENFTPRIDPPNWWTGFAQREVELMIHDKMIHDFDVVIKHKGVTIKKIERPENFNYLFVTLDISLSAKLVDVTIQLKKNNDMRTHTWNLSARHTDVKRNQGLTNKDFMYLIMPDRFANGDTSNDSFPDMHQKGIDRRKMYFRHGGDLKGIDDHLDYLNDLGVTALWLNPMQEDDQDYESYHGYAITDWYKVDRRFGTLKDYEKLVNDLHAKNMKMVMDVVPNHSGSNSYYLKDLPEATWVHQFDTFTRSTYKDQMQFDPHVSKKDLADVQNGWFDYTMADMNPEGNPHLENYIVQNHLWWLEETGVDAFRIDTYLYNDRAFMSRWAKRLRTEFPKFFLFGEAFVHQIINQAHVTENVYLPVKVNSNMQSVTDYMLYDGITEALTKQQTWEGGVPKLFQSLANDFIYANPNNNVIFFDNHDVSRFYSILEENTEKYKSAIAWLLTERGIPQWYYGAELGFTGYANPDGKVRQDMPGGWREDARSVFKPEQRTDKEKDLYNFTRNLAQWRKTKTCLQTGKLIHFLPVNGVYVYFRQDTAGTVMVAMNTSDKDVVLSTNRFSEMMTGFSTAEEIISHQKLMDLKTVALKKFETKVLELGE